MTSNENVRYLKMGDTFEITLSSNASSGYKWSHESKDNFDIIRIVPKNVLSGENFDPEMAVGAPMDLVYFITPKKPGEFKLRFEQKRPWEKNSSPVNVFEETVMVME